MIDILKNTLKDSLKAIKDYDGDITELQEEFDKNVKCFNEDTSINFEILYEATPFTKNELQKILNEKD